MNGTGCPSEFEVLQAARSGEYSPELVVHLAECVDCGDLALVGGILPMTEAAADPVVDLRQASLIWARADGERRRQRETWALLPLVIAESAACLLGSVALVGLAVNFISPLSGGMGAIGQRLLADPVIAWLAPVAALLVLGVTAIALALAIGFRTVRS